VLSRHAQPAGGPGVAEGGCRREEDVIDDRLERAGGQDLVERGLGLDGRGRLGGRDEACDEPAPVGRPGRPADRRRRRHGLDLAGHDGAGGLRRDQPASISERIVRRIANVRSSYRR
jgi:hypothetical protein